MVTKKVTSFNKNTPINTPIKSYHPSSHLKVHLVHGLMLIPSLESLDFLIRFFGRLSLSSVGRNDFHWVCWCKNPWFWMWNYCAMCPCFWCCLNDKHWGAMSCNGYVWQMCDWWWVKKYPYSGIHTRIFVDANSLSWLF